MRPSNLSGKSLQTYRQKRGWTRVHLGDRLGYTSYAIYRYETGLNVIPLTVALALAAIGSNLPAITDDEAKDKSQCI